MNASDAVVFLRTMIEIPSPSGGEQALAAYLAERLSQLGFQSSIDEVGNVIARRGNPSGPLICLLGHIDTVAQQIAVRQTDTLLYGRGAVDAKGPLATMILAAAEAEIADAQLLVVGAVEEETPGSRGARHLLDRYDPDLVIIGEPSDWSSLVIGYKGRVGIRYQVCRPPTHMAGPGEKATEVAIAFWNQLTAYMDGLAGDERLFYRPTATLGAFSGTIEAAQLDISFRIPPNFDLNALDQFLASIRGDAEIECDERTPAVLMERSTSPARALIGSIRAYGGKPSFKVKTGTSDMNTVHERWHVPMVAYGPGDSSLDHSAEEHIVIAEYLRAIDVLREALRRLSLELCEDRARAAAVVEDDVYTAEETEELTRRLEALGYFE
ncbi:MAG TPA: [LysW]-lysine hydrolase [Herpetosiphonaceae bacterium]